MTSKNSLFTVSLKGKEANNKTEESSDKKVRFWQEDWEDEELNDDFISELKKELAVNK